MLGKGVVAVDTQSIHTVFVPRQALKAMKWSSKKQIQVRAGRKTVTAQLRPTSEKLALSSDLFEELKLPRMPITWKFTEDQIRFGPFVAAYCIFTRRPQSPFESNTTVFKDMTAIARELSSPFYVLSPGSLNKKNKTTVGWFYDSGRSTWRKAEFPWPDFLIGKIILVPERLKSVVKEDQRMLVDSKCQMLSRSLGNKWDVYQALRDNSKITPHIPRTRKLRSFRDLSRMSLIYNVLYLKPVWGTQGRNIYRFSHAKIGYVVEYREGSQNRKLPFQPVHDMEWFRRRFLSRKTYLVQQGIQLVANQEGRSADFRWLIQKDGTGCWTITARVARIGVAKSITTNVSTGGDVKEASSFLRSAGLSDSRVTACVEQMDKLSIEIAEQMEKQVGKMGEIGIDFGVDTQGKVWLIELNPRPGRKMLKMLNPSIRALSLRKPLEYAMYTNGFADSSSS